MLLFNGIFISGVTAGPSFKGTYQSVERLEGETLWLAQGSCVVTPELKISSNSGTRGHMV